MFESATPIAFFQHQVALLRSQLPGLLDGRPDSIHDARIATRRLREVLPLTHEWQRRRDAGDFAARISELGRSLGKARDADVRIELLRYFEARLPHAGSSLALVRQRQERDRLMLARKLIKQLERLEVGEELARLSARAAWPRRRFWVAMTGAWRHQLRQLVAERAQAASAALVYATGVYFPNRSHAARIAIKKFRYAVEIGDQTGLLADQPLLRTLKKAQDLLGELHDRQTLIDELTSVAARPEVDAAPIALVVRVAEVEIGDLQARVLARRAEVLDACQRALRRVDRRVMTKGAYAVAGVVALAAGIEATRRHQAQGRRAADAEPGRAVSVRVPVPVLLPDAQTR
jgi:CHAD domain-containing protein